MSRQIVALAGAADEQVADAVDAQRAADRLAPLDQLAAPGGVLFGQCQATIAAIGGGADLGHGHERVPQPFGIDGDAHGVPPLVIGVVARR